MMMVDIETMNSPSQGTYVIMYNDVIHDWIYDIQR